ncbi:MAG: cache domain-containing protein [Methanospirillaceae archaeon]|nr:cache domain-containing protein [Methanospirillaceae archaeon]
MRNSPLLISLLVFLFFAGGCTGIQQTNTPVSLEPAETLPTQGEADTYPVLTAPRTSREIQEYVNTAASWAEKHEKEAALSAFNDPKGPFVQGDVYIYALDYDGVALALPFQPEMVGKDFIPLLDASGKPYTKVEIALAEQGGGYILYHYPYPAGDQPGTQKISYVRPVDDTYWIGAGLYTDEDHIISPDIRRFVEEAKTFAIENGKKKAVQEFNDITGSFTSGDRYIFAYEYDGTLLAWPYRKDLIGTNRINATDSVGTHHVQAFLTRAKQGSGISDYYSVNPQNNKTDLKISYVTDVDGTWMLGSGWYVEPNDIILGA